MRKEFGLKLRLKQKVSSLEDSSDCVTTEILVKNAVGYLNGVAMACSDSGLNTPYISRLAI